jgi:hypothetical protein
LEGGQWFHKIHPGTILALLGLTVVLLLRGPVSFLSEQLRYDSSAFQFLIVILLVSLITIARFGTGGAAYLVDTFALVAVYMMLAAYITESQKMKIVTGILVIVCLNSVIALSEFLLEYHFLEPQVRFYFFRANALFGHPLANGLMTTGVAIAVLKIPWRWSTKFCVIGLMLSALYAFGARGALAILVLGLVIFFAIRPYLLKGTFQVKIGRIVVYPAALVIVLIFIAFLTFQTNLGANIATRLMIDTSVEARLHSLGILDYLTFSEIFYGLDQSSLMYLVEQYQYVRGIENFWVVLLLHLGLPLFGIFVLSFLYLLFRQVKRGNWLDGLMVVVFILTASSNNSLSTKTAALAIFMLMMFCLRNSNFPDRRDPSATLWVRRK